MCVRLTQLRQYLQFTVNKIIYKMFGAMTKDSYCEISEYFGIPAVEQLIPNRHDRFLNRFRCQGHMYAKHWLCSLSLPVSFLILLFLYLLVLFVLNCYATMFWWWNKVVYIMTHGVRSFCNRSSTNSHMTMMIWWWCPKSQHIRIYSL